MEKERSVEVEHDFCEADAVHGVTSLGGSILLKPEYLMKSLRLIIYRCTGLSMYIEYTCNDSVDSNCGNGTQESAGGRSSPTFG